MRRRRLLVSLAASLAAVACAPRASSSPPEKVAGSPIEEVMAQIDAHLAELRRAFAAGAGEPRPADVAWVKLRLAHLVEVDQYLRFAYDKFAPRLDLKQQEALLVATNPLLIEVDAANTRELKQLLAIHGWFKISVFGREADRHGWLLVQHADQDPEFQRQVLALLEELYPTGETSPTNYAYLYDRVAISQQRPQRFGTQGDCVDGEWTAMTLEQPEAVDSLRASVGLPPLAEYAAQVRQVCPGARKE